MAWNDIDWANIQTGWQREQRAQRAQDEETVQNSVRASAQIRQERERSREFDVQTEERKREFDARLPLIQEQIRASQDANNDKQLFPILMDRLVNGQTTIEEAAPYLKTVPARENLMSLTTQMESKKAYGELGRILQGGVDLSTAEGQGKAWATMALHPEFGEKGFKALETAINHAQMSKDRELAALARASAVTDPLAASRVETIPDPNDPTKLITVVTPAKGSASVRYPSTKLSPVDTAQLHAYESGLRKTSEALAEAQSDLLEKKSLFGGSKKKEDIETLKRSESKVASLQSQVEETTKAIKAFGEKAPPAPVAPTDTVPERITPSGKRIRYNGTGDVNDPANWQYAE